jgi:hypothetical protein
METQRSDAPCPVCDGAVSGWAFACPRCGYHPDRYNRTLDDVALIFRLSSWGAAAAPPDGLSRVRSFLRRVSGRGAAGDAAGDAAGTPAAGPAPLQQTDPPPEATPGAGALR